MRREVGGWMGEKRRGERVRRGERLDEKSRERGSG
jgi:hypothetical protein